MRVLEKIIYFFAHHHKLEFAALVLALILFSLAGFAGYAMYRSFQKVNDYVAKGDRALQAEEFNQAIADFTEAKKASAINLDPSHSQGAGLTVTLLPNVVNKDIAPQIELAQKLKISHDHFIAGLNHFNYKRYVDSIAEFKLVIQEDQNYPIALAKIKEAEEIGKTEKETLAAFEDAYTKSLAACGAKDYPGCVEAADLALVLVKEEFHFDQSKVGLLKEKKKAAKAAWEAQMAEEERLKQGYNLRVPILMYHYIRVNPNPTDKVGFALSVTPADFEQQMQYLATHSYNAIDVSTLVAALKSRSGLPAKPVVITFDDGYRDFYTTAFPILKKYNLHAEIYVVSGFVGGANYMTWDMIKEVSASGLVTVGGHTRTHVDLTRATLTNLVKELVESKSALEANLGTKITDFCYPYGAFNSQVAAEVEKAGYTNATATLFGQWHSAGNYFALRRVRVGGGKSLASFISRL